MIDPELAFAALNVAKNPLTALPCRLALAQPHTVNTSPGGSLEPWLSV